MRKWKLLSVEAPELLPFDIAIGIYGPVFWANKTGCTANNFLFNKPIK